MNKHIALKTIGIFLIVCSLSVVLMTGTSSASLPDGGNGGNPNSQPTKPTPPKSCDPANDPNCIPDTSDPAAKSVTCKDASHCDLVQRYLNPLITLLSSFVGIVVVASIIISGIQLASSAGDPQKAAVARKHMTQAVIGLVAFMFLYGFLQFIIPGGLLNG